MNTENTQQVPEELAPTIGSAVQSPQGCQCGAGPSPHKEQTHCWWCGEAVLTHKELVAYGRKGQILDCVLCGAFWEDVEILKMLEYITKLVCPFNEVKFTLIPIPTCASKDKPTEVRPQIHLKRIIAKVRQPTQSPIPSQVQVEGISNHHRDHLEVNIESKNICIRISY